MSNRVYHQKPIFGQRKLFIPGHRLGPAGGLGSYHLFSEGDGDFVADCTPGGHDGTMVNFSPATAWKPTPSGMALWWTGIGGNRVTFDTIDQPQISIAMRLYNDNTGYATFPQLFNMPGYLALHRRADEQFQFVSLWDGVNGSWRSPDNSFSLNTWYDVMVTYDGSSTTNEAIIYFDGVDVGLEGGDTVQPVGNRTSNAGTGYIGNRADGARGWGGPIVYQAVWNRVLSPIKVNQFYRNPYCMFEPLTKPAWWWDATTAIAVGNWPLLKGSNLGKDLFTAGVN